jgi:hypothetical protein
LNLLRHSGKSRRIVVDNAGVNANGQCLIVGVAGEVAKDFPRASGGLTALSRRRLSIRSPHIISAALLLGATPKAATVR